MSNSNTVKTNKMGEGSLFPLIIKMAFPAMLSMLIHALYNIVDSYFVSQISMTDNKALAAISLAFPIQNLIVALAVGTGIGTSSLVSRQLGEERPEKAGDTATHGLILSLLTSFLVAAAGLLFSRQFFTLFSQDVEIVEMGTQYLTICCVFSIGCFLQVSSEKIIQATGDMMWPMITHIVGAIINMVFDPIFIFGYFGLPAMGVRGAAIATVLGQIAGMALSLFILFFRCKALHIHFRGFRMRLQIIRDIYAVGLPTIAMQSIGTLTITAMNGILATFSEAAYTVYGLYFKLQSFVFMPVFGLSQGLLPILAFNFGAKRMKRVSQALKIGLCIAGVVMVSGTLALWLMPERLLGIFNASPEILEIGPTALRIISSTFLFAGIGITISTLFQAVGKGVYSLINSLLRQLVILIPCAFLLSKISLTAIWFSIPISEFCSVIVTILLARSLYKSFLRDGDALS